MQQLTTYKWKCLQTTMEVNNKFLTPHPTKNSVSSFVFPTGFAYFAGGLEYLQIITIMFRVYTTFHEINLEVLATFRIGFQNSFHVDFQLYLGRASYKLFSAQQAIIEITKFLFVTVNQMNPPKFSFYLVQPAGNWQIRWSIFQ